MESDNVRVRRQLSEVIPPLSVVRVTSEDDGWNEDLGRIFRIGYYRRNDGLDCVWLVDHNGAKIQDGGNRKGSEGKESGGEQPQMPSVTKIIGQPGHKQKPEITGRKLPDADPRQIAVERLVFAVCEPLGGWFADKLVRRGTAKPLCAKVS